MQWVGERQEKEKLKKVIAMIFDSENEKNDADSRDI